MTTKKELEKTVDSLRRQIEKDRKYYLARSQEMFHKGVKWGRKQMAGDIRSLISAASSEDEDILK